MKRQGMLMIGALALLLGVLPKIGAQERLVVLPGTIQSVLGGGNWAPDNKATQMEDKGGGIYEFSADFPKGSYEYKVALDGSWTENYGEGGQRDGPNIRLDVPENNFKVRFVFDYNTKLVKDSISGGISLWSEPASVFLLGVGVAPVPMKRDSPGSYSLSMRLAKGSYSYRVGYNADDKLVFGSGGKRGGEGISLELKADTEISFHHRVAKAISWDSVSYVQIAETECPRVRAAGFSELTLSDDDYDNLWTGSLTLPPGKGIYDFTLLRGEKRAGGLRVNYNEIAPGFSISFSYDSKDGGFSSDYVEKLSGLDAKVLAKSLYHDSRDARYKKPFGAVKLGQTVEFTLSAKAGDLEKVKLVLRSQLIKGNQDSEVFNPSGLDAWMKKSGLSEDLSREYWSASVTFDENIAVYGYHFLASDGKDTVIYANNDRVVPVPHSRVIGTGGVGKAWDPADAKMLPYRLTVYDPAFTTPEWAKDAVFYYIFPERFRNGNKKNDPHPGKSAGYATHPVEKHFNWLDPKPWVPGSSDGKADDDGQWCNDFYGGDLAGITEKLDYIRDLGANVIYMNPIFQAPSNHKYDTADYKKIDPSFGTLKDFDKLVAEAKKRGIRVLLDTSLNHSGSDSVYMDRYGKYPGIGAFEKETIRADSPYADWYIFNPAGAGADQKYAQWGNPTLATLKESESYLDFAYGSKNSVTRYWLGRGIGGWRMDVTPWKSDDFWRGWRKAVKETNPDALTVAETWWDSSKYFLGDSFDSTMNYIFRQAVYDYASGGSAQDAVAALEMMRENYPPQAFSVLMNLLSTHDAARALYRFGYKGEGESAQVEEEAKRRLLLAVFMQMSYPGAPAIYYGDEVGMTGGEDPFNRGPYPWADLGGKVDTDLLESFKKLTRLRSENPILKQGSLAVLHADEGGIVMHRRLGTQSALVVTNNSNQPRVFELDAKALVIEAAEYSDPISGAVAKIEGGLIKLEVPALSGRAFISR